MTDIATDASNEAVSEQAILDSASSTSRRSSSQASRNSSDSRRNRTLRSLQKRGSRTPLPPQPPEDPSLTSFPSLSPEPEEQRPVSPATKLQPQRTTSQRIKHRKATLAGLTSASPSFERQNALFDDSPRSSLDIPGAVHLVNDDHIARLIAKVGASKLVRQYAQDLAQRDAEISLLRIRADERERELKKMLREVEVPSAEIEKRLLNIDKTRSTLRLRARATQSQKRDSTISIDSMMSEAIEDSRSMLPADESGFDAQSGLPDPPPTISRRSSNMNRLGRVASRSSSRADSVTSEASQDADSTIRPRQSSSTVNRLSGLQSIFQPPASTTTTTSYFIGGTNKNVQKAKGADEVSVKSTNSAKSSTSWTRLFGTRSQPTRSRASSVDQQNAAAKKTTASGETQLGATKARATLQAASMRVRPQAQRTLTATRAPSNPSHARKGSNASNLPPTVEMDSMIESSQLPPTMSNYNSEGLLIDRFGFIYDKKRKRQHLRANRHIRNKPSGAESLASHRSGDVSPNNENTNRPPTPITLDDDTAKKSWQDYLLPAVNVSKGRPRELLAHTPSAGAVVTVSTADAEGTITPPRHRDTSITVSSSGQHAMPTSSAMSQPQSSTIVALPGSFTHDNEDEMHDVGATKALLEQLTDLHDNLQAERTVKWNEFLRRVRAERANSTTDRTANNAPEAELVNGELIGIATLGRSSKTRSKYTHFRGLVLSGIPVSLRPKIWAECSGANSLRIPGYYEDLVTRSDEGSEMEPDIDQQIKADVKRTLRDNVFFRSPEAPGVQRLEELLRAYSLHNPTIGYCQGMNLITASLLLICATSEDCFWLLVAIIDHILPSGYFDQSLLVARADQIVLRQYVAEVLPKVDAKLQELGVELEACTFHWFLSLYTGVLTGGEALYRVWDVVLCLNSSDSAPIALQARTAAATLGVENYLPGPQPVTPTTPSTLAGLAKGGDGVGQHDGTSSPFLFQLSLALLKLNEEAILALESPAQVYTYLNHNMTAHNITIDALVNASELLRGRIKRAEVLEKRKKAMESLM